MKKTFSTTFFLILCAAATAQTRLTVERCWELARQRYPLTAAMQLIDRAAEYTVQNASKGYLPQFRLEAKASYQSDVTSIPADWLSSGLVPDDLLPDDFKIPELPRDNYDVHAEMGQVIWDGGRIGAQKQHAEANARVQRQSLEVELYTLRDRVNQLFFGILLLDGQLEQNRLMEQELGRNYRDVKAYVDGGVANRSDLDAVQVQQLETRQSGLKMESAREAYASMLGMLTGVEGKLQPVEPSGADYDTERIDRPELWLLDARSKELDAQRKGVDARNMPALGAFLRGGYGQPGLNMLKVGFEPYYIAGLRISWNFGSLYTRRNDLRLIDNSRTELDMQRETFLFNTRLQLIRQQRHVENIRDLVCQDDRIVELRGNLRRAAETKLANGTLSGTELMREVFAENLARQNRVLHRVQLIQAIYDIKTTTNN